ncbi:MAG TPA: Holliday junction resolvase RuvX [Patescibacteria group bacterium]|nr:Holliday junction resolvase RuvX [Patescibacteria group bacterium]
MPKTPRFVLALDVGEKRIGVALASTVARIASPLTTLANDESFIGRLLELIAENDIETLVVGLPRGLDGQDTAQTRYVRKFVEDLQAQIGMPLHMQDEAVTSAKAEAELHARGRAYTKENIDSLSATYILEDYLQGGAA